MFMSGRNKDNLVMRNIGAIAIGVSLGCVFVFFYPNVLFFPLATLPPQHHHRIQKDNDSQVNSSRCDPSERISTLKSEVVAASEEIGELKKYIKELSEKLKFAEERKNQARIRVGSFGTVKANRTNPMVFPDESLNPRLSKILKKIAINKELIVVIASSQVKGILEIQVQTVKSTRISNYLVVALDQDIVDFCKSKNIPFYVRDHDENVDSIARTGLNHKISGLKFIILREFLQLGYSVLLSDVDVIFLQNPFDHLYRDSDIESMTDGHDNKTAYGYKDIDDDPSMGWSRYAYTIRIWVYNSGFFYIRPTVPSIELLDRVVSRLSREPNAWDQAVFNEEMHIPSYPNYDGLYTSRRTMDFYLFMNSKVLFKFVRKDENLIKRIKPVIIHMNYHYIKLPRMEAVVEYYVNGKNDALKNFKDGSDW